MNMSLNKFFTIISIMFFALFLTLSYVFVQYSDASLKLSTLEKNRYETRMVANILRQSSDDLSRFAKEYVVTGNEEYKKSYNNILYIRNGELKTPKNYQNIYWDLLEPQRSQRHPLTKKTALENIIKTLPFTEYEIQKLKEAKLNSDELVNLEVEAFNAVAGLFKDKNGEYTIYDKPNIKKAAELLHSQDYLKAKEKIMLPIDEFLENLDNRTLNETNRYKKELNTTKNTMYMLSILILILFFIVIFAIRSKFLAPVLYLTEAINGFRRKKDVEKKLFYDDEIGYMIEEFFNMKNEIEKDMKLIMKNKRDLEQYLKLIDQNIITSSTDLNGKITFASEAFCQISGYTQDELLGKNHRISKHPDMKKEVFEDLWKTITDNKIWKGEIKNITKDGSYYWVDATIYPSYDENGNKIGYTSIRIDITSKKQVYELLEKSKLSEKKIKQYINLIDKNIITSSTDLSGKITYVSEAFAEISGYTKDELIGKSHRLLKHEDNDPYIYENLWETISHSRIWHGVIKNKKKDGTYYWVDATIYPIFDDYGEKTGYTAIRIDITDRKMVEDLLITDALTNIYNRRYFNEMMPKAINRAKRDKKYFSFIIIDIDYFKQYNDTYGHHEGDEVLAKVASAIKGSIHRAGDLCFRLGGEEFGVIFESLDPEEAFNLANSIRTSVENLKIEHKGNSASRYVTISMGLVTKKSVENLDMDKLYKEADNLLYKAKQSGRNKIEANL